MTPQIRQWVENKVRSGIIPRQGSILEVGSRNVNGEVRSLFDQADYVGMDREPGPGVDLVSDVCIHSIMGEFDLIICLETLEHVPRFWVALENIRQGLKSGGLLLVSAPTTGFPEHRHPVDCYRFMRDAFPLTLFSGMDMLDLDQLRDDAGYPCLIGLARSR